MLQFLLHTLKLKFKYFRMDNNQVLNSSYDFNGYLVCQIPENTFEVELKIKTTRGKYTLNKDTYTRTEKYHPWTEQIEGLKSIPEKEGHLEGKLSI